ncbi:minor capsid protein [Schinkia azotoformans]|uniref:minor capsid protein n=1 Tax=Schinkia azotoformans TaxID=1454 RepID=UPI002DBF44DC|nr:minor capsid protein [Schinkia azotoformans]MEC1714761.1 minor capsid protein [Schinkia azotoformans]MEC1757483.1 minor capsid protein [Schinkia azotoformans]
MESKDLIQYLTDSGFNVFPDANFIPADITESQLPALFVFGTGGFASHDYLPFKNPTFQVIVKGKDYQGDYSQMSATESLANNLIQLLNNKSNYLIGNTEVIFSKAMQSNPIPLGLDDKSRPTFSTNFQFRIKEV